MFGRLLILFTVVPAAEIYLLLRIGEVIGGMNTFLLVLMTGVVGAYYARQQGFTVLLRMQAAAAEGRTPASEMWDGVLILIGGILLVTPGLLTDLFGISLLIPATRAFWKHRAARWLQGKIERGEIVVHSSRF